MRAVNLRGVAVAVAAAAEVAVAAAVAAEVAAAAKVAVAAEVAATVAVAVVAAGRPLANSLCLTTAFTLLHLGVGLRPTTAARRSC